MLVLQVLQVLLLIGGLIALVIGYRRHNRGLLLAAALARLVAGAVSEVVTGFNDSRARHEVPRAALAPMTWRRAALFSVFKLGALRSGQGVLR